MKLKDVYNFLNGNFNYVLDQYNMLSETMRQKADSRIEICEACPDLETNTERPHCKHCLCSFPQLTFADKKECPLKKW